MQPILGPLDGDWSAWGSPLDRKRDLLAQIRKARGEPVHEEAIRAMEDAELDRLLLAAGFVAWTPSGFGRVGGGTGGARGPGEFQVTSVVL